MSAEFPDAPVNPWQAVEDDGLMYWLVHDIETGEIYMPEPDGMPFMHFTDQLAYDEYREGLKKRYGIDDPALDQVIESAKERYRSYRSADLDYWGRPANGFYY